MYASTRSSLTVSDVRGVACERPALRLLDELKANGLRPDNRAYNAVLSAVSGSSLHKTATAATHGKGGERSLSGRAAARAVELLEEMRDGGVDVDVATYNTVMVACAVGCTQ